MVHGGYYDPPEYKCPAGLIEDFRGDEHWFHNEDGIIICTIKKDDYDEEPMTIEDFCF
jgi:hypothetical protein